MVNDQARKKRVMETLSNEAKKLIKEIKDAGDLAFVASHRPAEADLQSAWDELIKSDILNIWSDDTGTEYVEIGCQQW
jgi:2',3'-cyclic-nucleotide 2'-phosphodiesterase (5'-nucleotidase family)